MASTGWIIVISLILVGEQLIVLQFQRTVTRFNAAVLEFQRTTYARLTQIEKRLDSDG